MSRIKIKKEEYMKNIKNYYRTLILSIVLIIIILLFETCKDSILDPDSCTNRHTATVCFANK